MTDNPQLPDHWAKAAQTTAGIAEALGPDPTGGALTMALLCEAFDANDLDEPDYAQALLAHAHRVASDWRVHHLRSMEP